ncbi:transposable element Tcb2 transposase [Trichonephila clavipes]|nr:transposable element Tcb2 transposase [Trichonephila clavipes]
MACILLTQGHGKALTTSNSSLTSNVKAPLQRQALGRKPKLTNLGDQSYLVSVFKLLSPGCGMPRNIFHWHHLRSKSKAADSLTPSLRPRLHGRKLPAICRNESALYPFTRRPGKMPAQNAEHVWDQLKRQIPSCPSVHDLELAVQDLWAHLPQDNIRCLINSMLGRVAACIAAEGGPTRY